MFAHREATQLAIPWELPVPQMQSKLSTIVKTKSLTKEDSSESRLNEKLIFLMLGLDLEVSFNLNDFMTVGNEEIIFSQKPLQDLKETTVGEGTSALPLPCHTHSHVETTHSRRISNAGCEQDAAGICPAPKSGGSVPFFR